MTPNYPEVRRMLNARATSNLHWLEDVHIFQIQSIPGSFDFSLPIGVHYN